MYHSPQLMVPEAGKSKPRPPWLRGPRRDGFLGQKGHVWTMPSTAEQNRLVSQPGLIHLPLPGQSPLLSCSCQGLHCFSGYVPLLPALTPQFPSDLSTKAVSVHVSPILLPLTKSVLVYCLFPFSHSDLASCSWGFESCFSKTWVSQCHRDLDINDVILFIGICSSLSKIFCCQRTLHSARAGERPSYCRAWKVTA